MMALSAGFVLLLSIAAGQAAEPCEPALARVVSLQGQVEVQRGESGAWTPAALDDQLCIGDGIRVGRVAQAALALANDSVLNIDQLTTMRLGAPAATGRSLLELLFGDVHFFSHRPRALEIDTPIANAGAEGTEFLMRARADRTEVVMFEGRVRLRTPAGELLLAGGDAAVATAGAAPRREVIARPRDAVAWALYYPPILAPLAERRAAPSALPPGLQTAIQRVAANDYAGAIAALDAVPEARRDARYYAYRAGVLLNVGRADEAAQAIDRALALNAEAAEALAERAMIELVQNRRADALADARRAVELTPDSAPARIALSYALQASFDLEAARATLQEAAARAPEDALVQARLAELELSFGDLDAARAAAARAVALAPELERTQMVLGFAALTRIDIGQAKAAFERAIELDSAEPLARLGLGLAKIRAGDLEDGRRELEIAVALDPNNSLLRSYLGKAYFEARRAPQDAEQFQIAKQLDPNDPTPYFYDALRKQSENRPVEALRDLETSIRLNDNRAVYRSRLLLDQDRASRAVSLARIYDDLGFDQLALVEASQSLSQDPGNWSAHRFLADSFRRLPGHEIARASEALQSQLLQPVNINPVPPTLSVTDLNLAPGAGPADAAFNEFHSLFERNQAQITATGALGNEDTLADEVVVSGLYDSVALSAGQFYSDSDGFRRNNEVKNNLYNLFGQVAVTPKLNLQAEYRRRESRQGDLEQRFDQADINDDRRRINQDSVRIGARFSPSPKSDLIASAIFTDRNEDFLNPAQNLSLDDQGYQVETRYIYNDDDFGWTAGLGRYDINVDQRSEVFDPVFGGVTDSTFNREQNTGYAYFYPRIGTLVATLGFGYDDFEQRDTKLNEASPKLGFSWNVTDRVLVRGAAFQTIKHALSVDQTIEPTEVAGFNQLFDDINGTKSDRYGLGVDVRAAQDLYVGAEASVRHMEVPVPTFGSEDQRENLYFAYLYWTPAPKWALDGQIRYDRFQRDDTVPDSRPLNLDTVSLPITLRYFATAGWFAQLGVTYVQQQVERFPFFFAPSTRTDHDDFFLVDAAVGYRLPQRRGILSFEVENLFDQGFKYQDDNFRTVEQRVGPFIPERTFLGRLTITF